MKRFTVSVPDDLYAALRSRGEEASPPATLQQMVRFAIDSFLAAPVDDGDAGPETADVAHGSRAPDPVDLLVFSVGDVVYGIPIEMVETVAANLPIHQVPSASGTLVGVTGFRDELTEVHDGGTVLQGRPLAGDDTGSLLAVPTPGGRVLMTVTAVAGLSPAAEAKWATPTHLRPGLGIRPRLERRACGHRHRPPVPSTSS